MIKKNTIIILCGDIMTTLLKYVAGEHLLVIIKIMACIYRSHSATGLWT